MPKKSKSQERREAIQNEGEQAAKEKNPITLRLLKNCYIRGNLEMKGFEMTLPYEVAQKKMQTTSGLFEVVGEAE